LEFLSWIIDGVGGWRYLISPSFRKRTHARWKLEGWITASTDILFGGLAVAFTLFLLGLLFYFTLGAIYG